jgi:putative Holliday junction resolvase
MTFISRGSSSAPPATARASRIVLPGFRILAIDYGRKRIGLAVSDELHLTARPLGALLRKNSRQVLRCVSQIARENSVGKILIGHPLHLNGRNSEMAVEAERFAARVQKQLGLPVEMVDERLTSWEAEQQLAGLQGARGRARTRHNLDSVAAAILLREYLERTPDPKKGPK